MEPLLVDVHAHLDDARILDDAHSIVERAKQAGVAVIVTNGVSAKTNRAALELAERFDIVEAALGIYPQEAERMSDLELEQEIDFIREHSKDIAAVGEVGLDLHWTKAEEEEKLKRQRYCFGRMIGLATERDQPLIVHSRKAEEECIDMLEQHDAKKVIMHCFSGSRRLVEQIIKNQWYFSIPANIGKSEQFQSIVRLAPLNQLLTETDAPYLSPYPGRLSEPSFVAKTVEVIAKIKGFNSHEVIQNIFANYQRLFCRR